MTVVPRVAELATALARNGVPIPVRDVGTALASGAEPCVVVLTEWTLGIAEQLSRLAWAGPGWLVPLRFDGGLALIGPALGPNARCCLACAEANRLHQHGRRPLGATLRLGGRPAAVDLPALGAVVLDAAGRPEGHDGLVTAARIGHATVSAHPVRPRRQGCDICAPVPPDSPEAARVDLTSVPAADRFAVRADNPRAVGKAMHAALVDWRHGPVAHVSRVERSPLPWSVAEMAGEGPGREAGYGRSVGSPGTELEFAL